MSSLRHLPRDLPSVLLALAVSIFPIYSFESGGLQFAHVTLVLFVFYYMFGGAVRFPVWAQLLLATAVYAFVVEAFYAIRGGHPAHLIHAVYFLFNLLVAICVYLHILRRGLGAIAIGVPVSLLIVSVSLAIDGALFFRSGGGRSVGTFNNPNQLGFFSVCIVSLSYLLYSARRIGYTPAAAYSLLALLMAITSLSKAAMIAIFAVILFALAPKLTRRTFVLWGVGAGLGAYGLWRFFESALFERLAFVQRLSGLTTETDSSLASRGYAAIFEGNGLQLIFGIGADRADEILGHEVHSTFASVFNYWGILGFLPFAALLVLWGIRIWRVMGFTGVICVTGPSMLYGITHNGTRFSLFWILFAASLAVVEAMRTGRPDPAGEGASDLAGSAPPAADRSLPGRSPAPAYP